MKYFGNGKKTAWIVGIALHFHVPLAFSQSDPTNFAATVGPQSPAIGTVQGNLTINYGSASAPQHAFFLHRNDDDPILIVSHPGLDEDITSNAQVCTVSDGTRVAPYGDRVVMNQLFVWRKVKILSGDCADKVGWTMAQIVSK